MGSRAVSQIVGVPMGQAWEIYRVACGHSAVLSVAAFNFGSGDDAIDLAIGDAHADAGQLREEQWIIRDLPVAARARAALLAGLELTCCQGVFARRRGLFVGAATAAGPGPGDIVGVEPSSAAGAGGVSIIVSGREFQVAADEEECA